jgi:hypothetical protein
MVTTPLAQRKAWTPKHSPTYPKSWIFGLTFPLRLLATKSGILVDVSCWPTRMLYQESGSAHLCARPIEKNEHGHRHEED